MVAPTPRVPRIREPLWDNARLLAAVLICAGHFTDPFVAPDNSWAALWVALWPFRVPVFVVLSGYFTSTQPHTLRSVWALVRDIALVYVIFQTIAILQQGWYRDIWDWSYDEPGLALWFLLSLFVWRLAAPYLWRIPGRLIVAFAVAILGGFLDLSTQWAWARTVAWLPLFVVGLELRNPRFVAWLRVRTQQIVASVLLTVSLAAGMLLGGQVRRSPLMMRSGYSGAFESQIIDAGVRSVALVVAAVLALALLSVIPRGRIVWWTALGAGSFTVYLLHPVVLRYLASLDVFSDLVTTPRCLAWAAGAVLLGLVLATPPVRRATAWLTRPRTFAVFMTGVTSASRLRGRRNRRPLP